VQSLVKSTEPKLQAGGLPIPTDDPAIAPGHAGWRAFSLRISTTCWLAPFTGSSL